MCFYPKLLRNKKYMPTKKNNYNAPELLDEKFKYVAVGCGNCLECRKQKARGWQVRLTEEIKSNKFNYFCTFTFAPEELKKLCNTYDIEDCNKVATKAMRLYLERWRKKYKVSIKHWFVTELGHTNTERIHLHGLLFSNTELNTEEITKTWKYGNTYIGEYCTLRTVNYIVKYITKIDTDHKNYKPITLASKGIGKAFIESAQFELHKYKPLKTKEYYLLPNGFKINMPIYYRNKLYSEDEREKLWSERIDKNEIFVHGVKIENIDTKDGQLRYFKQLKTMQQFNQELGYTNDKWHTRDYKITFKMINSRARNNKV